MVAKLSSLAKSLYKKIDGLEQALLGTKNYSDPCESAEYYKSSVLTAMSELREVADELETVTAEKYWPLPTYGDLLFSV